MSHTVYVPGSAPNLQQLLAAVPRAVQASAQGGELSLERECIVATGGSARGVALSLAANDEGDTATAVRLFTCSSREDVALGIDLVAALMALGEGHALNEDGEPFASPEELREHYGPDFVASYVEWGPGALVEGAAGSEDGETLQMTGPWAPVSFRVGEIRAWQKAGVLVESVLGALASAQQVGERVRGAIAEKDVQTLRGYLAAPQTAAVLAGAVEVLALDAASASSDDACKELFRSLRGLHEVVGPSIGPEAAQPLLMAAGLGQDDSAEGRELARAIFEAANRHAEASFSFAEEIANTAYGLTQEEEFPRALALFDFVVSLPRLEGKAIETDTRVTPGGKPRGPAVRATLGAQATWACNALWAVSADNNKLPVQPERARRYLAACLPYAPENPGIFFNAACVAFELGERDRVFEHIRGAVRHGFDRLDAIRTEPLLAPLRGDPRFAEAFRG